MRLEISFPETYPDVVPSIVVKYSHILPKHAEALTKHLEAEAENLIGCVMVWFVCARTLLVCVCVCIP